MDRNREKVQQQAGGDKGATSPLPGRSEHGNARDQAGIQDHKSQQQVRHVQGFLGKSGPSCPLYMIYAGKHG